MEGIFVVDKEIEGQISTKRRRGWSVWSVPSAAAEIFCRRKKRELIDRDPDDEMVNGKIITTSTVTYLAALLRSKLKTKIRGKRRDNRTKYVIYTNVSFRFVSETAPLGNKEGAMMTTNNNHTRLPSKAAVTRSMISGSI